MTLDDVLAVVAGRVSYLRASVSTDGDNWRSCATLISNRGVLVDVVTDAMSGFGTDDEAVAASLFTQAYAFRVAGVALAAYALDLPVPDVAPDVTAVRVDKPRPSAVAYLNPAVRRRDAATLADELIGGHLGGLVDAVHEAFRVGERLLWGNVAASCAVAFRAVEGSVGEGSGGEVVVVRQRAQSFFAAAHRWFEGLGAFTVVEHAGREGWYWDRTSCCLWFRTKSEQLCDNCSLTAESELRESRLRELTERAS
jgi:cobalamin transport system ATP-binding protein